jgi:hypothetical protein
MPNGRSDWGARHTSGAIFCGPLMTRHWRGAPPAMNMAWSLVLGTMLVIAGLAIVIVERAR